MNKSDRNTARKYYKKVKKDGTIYVWGMNYPTIITKESIDKAYRDCGSDKYNRSYYAGKLAEGSGKPGSDCSGMHAGLSGYDTRAQDYYYRCKEKGDMSTLPIDDLVLLFKGSSPDNIVHTGTYYGNCMCIHMKSSYANCVEESVDAHGWTFWGKPDFIDYTPNYTLPKPILVRRLQRLNRGVDVKFVQKVLNENGFDCGKVDGEFGRKTEKAVTEFQKANGAVNRKTGRALGFKIAY